MGEQRLSEASAWKYLIESLTMLAVDVRDQTTWLDRYRLETDDLALDFENAQSAIAILVEAGRIDVATQSRFAHIDVILDAMSGVEQASRWTYEALATDAGWLKVRQLAREALTELAGTWQQPLPTLGIYGVALNNCPGPSLGRLRRTDVRSTDRPSRQQLTGPDLSPHGA